MKHEFKFFVPLAMLYTAVALADLVLVYRMSSLESMTITAGIYVMPIYYFLEDMIAELYGYERIRQVIWSVQLSAAVFSLIVTLALLLPTPHFWHHEVDYKIVFGHLFRTLLGGGLVAMLGGAFVNGYILSKLKIKTKGRFFYFRSIGSSCIGQLFQTTVGCILIYAGIIPFNTIIHMIIPLYCIQLIGCILVAMPGSLLIRWLKKCENIDIYDHNVNFNPFKFSVTTETNDMQFINPPT